MLTSAQQDRLQSLHAYEWVDEDPDVTKRNLDSLFQAIETEAELWYASFIVPWDFADGSLPRILNHPLCDRGIALLLYWSLDPISLHRSDAESTPLNAELISEIEGRFAQSQYQTEQIAFSPLDSPNYREDHVGIPGALLVPSTGMTVEFDYRNAVFPNQEEGG